MIEHHGHNLILKYTPEGGSILELGNQIMNLENVQEISAKEYYTKLGYEHTSIDLNGKDGALPLNLSEPMDMDLEDFDIITDMGTSEHVEDIYRCLINVYNCCQEDTIIIHKNPKTGNFPMHGNHFFTIDFWKAYADLCRFKIIEIYEHAIYHNNIDGWECIAILQFTDKTDSISMEKFNTIKHLIKKS